MAAEPADDPALIQDDVERTQDAMGATVQKLEDKLNPRKIAQSMLSDDNADTARDAWEVVTRSPVPVAMIAAGTAWLLATSDAPMISRFREELKRRFRGAIDSAGSDDRLRPRSAEPAPIGPPPPAGEAYDRRSSDG